ncbi:MAG: glycosyltransferase involved in cell wall biosynthesis [Myxococcota bacterium]
MRVAVLGAFPYPYPQGSQVFVTDHSRALARSGVNVSLFTYGSGLGAPPEDLTRFPTPTWLTPSAMRSGPTLGKFPADAGLLATYLAAHRREHFDIAFAHNAEAAMIAIAARPFTKTPVVYIAHTVLEHELAAYAPSAWDSLLTRAGAAVDRFIAKRADGIIALCEDARDALAPYALGPITIIPPGLDAEPAPAQEQVHDVCTRFSLTPDRFALYCGNLDGYQDLDLLADAARHLASCSPAASEAGLPLVIATHDASRIPNALGGVPNLSIIEVDDFAETRALIAAAQSVVLSRRRRGGFPIKLLNYMNARKPIVAFTRVAPGFEPMQNAWLLDQDDGGVQLGEALHSLSLQPELRKALGEGACQLLTRDHQWAQLTQKTRAFVETVLARRSAQGS